MILDAVPDGLLPAVRVTTTTLNPRTPPAARCAHHPPGGATPGRYRVRGADAGEYISYRESLCKAVAIHDNDDWTYSRFGLNGLTQGLRDEYMRLCGADVRVDTQDLVIDVVCAGRALRVRVSPAVALRALIDGGRPRCPLTLTRFRIRYTRAMTRRRTTGMENDGFQYIDPRWPLEHEDEVEDSGLEDMPVGPGINTSRTPTRASFVTTNRPYVQRK